MSATHPVFTWIAARRRSVIGAGRGGCVLVLGWALIFSAGAVAGADLGAPETSGAVTVAIPGGAFRPLFAKPEEASQNVAPFRLDTRAISNAEYLTFVRARPRWSRPQIASAFADERYLSHWQAAAESGELVPVTAQARAPVTQVSWFAARAYCQWRGAQLPTTAQWELVASADEQRFDARRDPVFRQRILDWYARPNTALAASGSGPANAYGVHDLHGLIWEWTEDFAGVLSTGESRNDSATDNQFFCGSGAAGSADPSEYATFMRYALRASLQARYTLANLGFRCAQKPDG